MKNQAKWAQYVDYDKITCRFSNPTGLPPVNYVNIVIFNRDHNSISSASIKNVPLTTINNLLEYYTRFHTEPMLPRPLPSSMKINEDLIPVDQITNDDEQWTKDRTTLNPLDSIGKNYFFTEFCFFFIHFDIKSRLIICDVVLFSNYHTFESFITWSNIDSLILINNKIEKHSDDDV